ncbi:hypothetical protein NMY22_g8237 [Coprinellus aureogranulatus]|nr:hypothetical protein NMY22_g8237 [Coprinellus aureogranulatus]
MLTKTPSAPPDPTQRILTPNTRLAHIALLLSTTTLRIHPLFALTTPSSSSADPHHSQHQGIVTKGSGIIDHGYLDGPSGYSGGGWNSNTGFGGMGGHGHQHHGSIGSIGGMGMGGAPGSPLSGMPPIGIGGQPGSLTSQSPVQGLNAQTPSQGQGQQPTQGQLSLSNTSPGGPGLADNLTGPLNLNSTLTGTSPLNASLNGNGNVINNGNGTGNGTGNGGNVKQTMLANEKRRRRRESHNAVERRCATRCTPYNLLRV